MSSAHSDRNLLFGIMALQMDFISRDALVTAMQAWVLEKSKPLGEILVAQGAMAADARVLLEPLVQKHVEMHDNDPQKSLASIGSASSARRELAQIADSDVQASLAHVSMFLPAGDVTLPTQPHAVGTPTASGLRFRVLRPHAKGGLGQVSVALDQELRREVALKEIQDRHADQPESRGRFVREAEITGGLEHPGIVPVYGLGTYPDGRPFYTMRFIRGDSLQEAIARFHKSESSGHQAHEQTLALRQLLGRFIDVCDAIAYAHSRGVLHRDLKPGNVMLGPYGETLVVDWGLAKPMGVRATDGDEKNGERTLRPALSDSATPTQAGAALGTPAFMPPEQAAGRLDELGPASDVYSLGATLYCLLTGKAPFEGGEVGEVLRRVQAGDFPRPRAVRRDVPAALEAICLKAMALKPQDRYAGPRALAADVERWLADEPVSAYREPWRMRVGRWARHHQTLMAAAATGLLVMMLTAGSAAWWLDRQRAEQRRGVESALEEVARLQGQGRWSEARAVLGQAKDRLGEGGPRDLREKLAQGECNLDLVARLDDIRLKRATLVEIGLHSAYADREYEEAFREAGMEEVGGDTDKAAAWVSHSGVRGALVAALDDWAGCAGNRSRRAWVLAVSRRADPDPWRNRLRDPNVWEDKTTLARLVAERDLSEQSPQLLAVLGYQLMLLGADPEPLWRAAQERHPSDFWLNFELGNFLTLSSFSRSGLVTPRDLGFDFDLDATAELEAALAKPSMSGEAVGYYRAALAVRPRTPAVHASLGFTLYILGRREEAIAEYRKAIELDPKYGPAHDNLCTALRDQGKLEEAATECRQAIEFNPKDAHAHINLSAVLADMGRRGEAVAEFRKANELDPNIPLPQDESALTLLQQGRFAEALRSMRRCLDLLPDNHPQWRTAALHLRQCEQVLALDKKLAAILKGEVQPADAAEQLRLARLCVLKKHPATAIRFYADAFAAQPGLADDLATGRRYDAACAAALAAAGQGEDAPKSTDKERARLRRQALDWLRSDLALWSKQIAKGTPQQRAIAQQTLRYWQQDADLAGLRNAAALDKLPEAERADCRKLWNEVASLLKK